MEQARFRMWANKKPDPTRILSWEEQAFAEDAAGPLGGCVWPPRSYSCSFCRREFRSAQALGGHMNVHRRDRARLKESQDPDCTFMYNHNQEIRVSSPSPPSHADVKVITSSHENAKTLSFSPTKNDVLLWDRVLGSKKNGESVICGKKTKMMTSTYDDDDKIFSLKRKRIEEKTSSLFPRRVGQSEVSKLHPVLVEELDLELRLGCAPKVK